MFDPEKIKSKGEANNLKYGLCAWQNLKDLEPKPMEDTYCTLLSLPKQGLENWSFFGVFDGHGGDEISDYVSKELINSILNADQELFECLSLNITYLSEQYEDRLKNAITNGFLQLDNEMRLKFKKSGSTAVACLITPTQIYLINCGDSRGLIVSDNQIKIATKDHNPNDSIELDRIKKADGTVKPCEFGGLFSKKRIEYYVHQLNGLRALAMSRSFGDYHFKSNSLFNQIEQIIIAKPDIYVYERLNEKDEFLILATDGIWDKIINEDLKQYIHYRLSIMHNLDDLCEEVVEICENRVIF
jgi:serine/threonine protein phosphatase PrpC